MIESPKKDIRIPFLIFLTIVCILWTFFIYAGEIQLRRTSSPENLLYREISTELKVTDQFLNMLLISKAENAAIKKKVLEDAASGYERATVQFKNTGIYYCQLGIINAESNDIKKARKNFEAGKKNGEEALGGLLEDIYLKSTDELNKLSAPELSNADKIIREKLTGWFLYSPLETLYTRINSPEFAELLRQANEFTAKKTPGFLLLIFLLFGLPAAGFIAIPLYIFVFRKKELLNEEIFPVKWTAIDAWSVFITWEMMRIILSLVIPLLGIRELGIYPSFLITFLISFFILFLIYDVMKKLGCTVADIGLKSTGFIRKAFYGIFALAACFLPISFSDIITQYLYKGPHVSSNPILDVVEKSGGFFNLFLIFLLISVIAPVFEEILFRGFLYSAFRKRLGIVKANLFVSLVFSLTHHDIATFLSIFVLGMILAYTFEKTRSLIPSIILHSLFNLHTLVIMRLLISS
ncbi:MAG: CPBP family intramembrane metalloprotease [Firmicutes bacterium]|nr:CPBP family intramembrane metalloprotease [Bacillota bacterium]